jgi:cbb3-type cytochrome oxidase subunit 3
MYKDVLNAIDGAALFPMISLLIFFGFFVVMLIYVYTKDKTHINEMAAMPLADNSDFQEDKNNA